MAKRTRPKARQTEGHDASVAALQVRHATTPLSSTGHATRLSEADVEQAIARLIENRAKLQEILSRAVAEELAREITTAANDRLAARRESEKILVESMAIASALLSRCLAAADTYGPLPAHSDDTMHALDPTPRSRAQKEGPTAEQQDPCHPGKTRTAAKSATTASSGGASRSLGSDRQKNVATHDRAEDSAASDAPCSPDASSDDAVETENVTTAREAGVIGLIGVADVMAHDVLQTAIAHADRVDGEAARIDQNIAEMERALACLRRRLEQCGMAQSAGLVSVGMPSAEVCGTRGRGASRDVARPP